MPQERNPGAANAGESSRPGGSNPVDYPYVTPAVRADAVAA